MQVYYFDDLADVMHKLDKFIQFHNNRRIHSSLQYKTPNRVIAEYEKYGYNQNIMNLRV